MANNFNQINSSSSQAAIVAQVNRNFAKLDAETNLKTFGGQNSPDKLLIGKTSEETLGLTYRKNDDDKMNVGRLPNGEFGLVLNDEQGTPSIYMAITESGKPVLKVAKDGKNAETDTGDDLIFDSSQNVMKIVKTGTVTMSPPATWPTMGVVTQVIPHGQPTIPAFMVYVQNPSGLYYTYPGLSNLPSYVHLGPTGEMIFSSARADSTNLYIDLSNVSSLNDGLDDLVWSYKYLIFQESGI
ncbi:hypothetical protein [Rathayibacter sp. VKM Ac-2805]|uniref:hypothetical protein n=1 Tax=Rathayibacter sp. VKM Ac-2805 TaxID=2609258 RepID=UPI00131F785D|nr:hypothetical protein [Rathayibacter sp. VKM Ac-2805]QHC73779.1 hypothetical protein GSU40_08880 [Rathayibacter sp. VKM Ac-2805]